MRDFRPQIVHTHMAKAGTLGRLAAAIYNRTAGRGDARVWCTPITATCSTDTSARAKTRLFLAIERGLARATDRIVAISPQHPATSSSSDYRIGRAGSVRRRAARLRSLRRSRRSTNAREREARAALNIEPDAARRHHRRPPDRHQAAVAVSRGRGAGRGARSAWRLSSSPVTGICAARSKTQARALGLDRPRPLPRLAARSRDDLRRVRSAPADVAQRRDAGRADREPGVPECPVSAPTSAASETCSRATRSVWSRRRRRGRPGRSRQRRCSAIRSGAGAWAAAGRALVVARYGLDRLVGRRRDVVPRAAALEFP